MGNLIKRETLFTPLGGHARRETLGAVLALGLLGTLVAVDIASGAATALPATFVLAPFVAAVLSTVGWTAAVAVLALVLAAASGEWNMNLGAVDWWIRMGVLLVGGVFAVAAAWSRTRSAAGTRRLELLDQVGAVANGSLPLAETIDRVLAVVVPEFADLCMVDVIREGRATRSAVRVSEHPQQARIDAGIRVRTPSLPEWMLRPDSPFPRQPWFQPRFNDEDLRRIAHGEEDRAFLETLGVRSAITTPMIARNRMLGAVTLVVAWSGRRYDDQDLIFAQALAGRMALALDNAGLFSDLESVERRMDNVMSILDEAVVIHDSAGELIYANNAAAQMLGFDDPEQLIAMPTATLRERYTLRAEDGTPLDASEFVGRRALQGEATEPLVMRVAPAEGGRERWYVTKAKPIKGPGDQVLYSVTAIEDVTEVKRAEFAQRLLARTGELLASSTDYRHTLQGVAQLAVPEFADWCSVNLPTAEGTIEQVALAHSDPAKVELGNRVRELYPASMADETGLADALRRGEARVLTLTDEILRGLAADDEHLRLIRELEMGLVIVAPMTAAPKIVGIFAFGNDRGSRHFDQDDLRLAREIGRRAGVAVENARLAGERAEVAKVLQRGLLPPALPEMPGWEAAAMYRPAGEVNEVGGDFYDAFRVDGGWMIAVGDVVGRGAAAASLTALARYTIRTAGVLTGNPRTALRMLDEGLRARSEMALCTVAILILPDADADPADVLVVSAGHPLPLLLRDGAVEEAGRPGPLLGAFEGCDWEVETVRLASGDQLVVYTDGVIEARGGSERFGESRLRAGIAGTERPMQTIARLEGSLEAFLAGEPQDDVAVVAVRRAGAPAPREAPPADVVAPAG